MHSLHKIITTKQDPELISDLELFIGQILPDFKQALVEHPLVTPSQGCCSVSEAFWLYSLVRTLQPETIIESGTFEGYSLYFLWYASSSTSRVLSFDPFNEPKYELPKEVEYFAKDWTQHSWNELDGNQTLIFFDDHLHHGKRLRQAYNLGIRHVVFHDNYLSPVQSHVPIRYVNLLGLVKHYYAVPLK